MKKDVFNYYYSEFKKEFFDPLSYVQIPSKLNYIVDDVNIDYNEIPSPFRPAVQELLIMDFILRTKIFDIGEFLPSMIELKEGMKITSHKFKISPKNIKDAIPGIYQYAIDRSIWYSIVGIGIVKIKKVAIKLRDRHRRKESEFVQNIVKPQCSVFIIEVFDKFLTEMPLTVAGRVHIPLYSFLWCRKLINV